jgi:hypothetical protein
MQADIQEIYATAIRPLSAAEKLRIAALILEEVTGQSSATGGSQTPGRRGDITKFFGSWKGGRADDSENERIDADLARAYARDAEAED